MGLVEDVESGDKAKALRALRAKLVQTLDRTTDPGDIAALTLRLQRVLDDLDAVGGDEKETDDLAARRNAKLAAASGS